MRFARQAFYGQISQGLMIFGGRRGSSGGSIGRRMAVQLFRIVVTILMTSAPPTAGQNPDTVKPFTR